MNKKLIIMAILFCASIISIYISSIYQILYFGILGNIFNVSLVGYIILILLQNKKEFHVFILILVISNTIFAFLAISGIIYPEYMVYAVGVVSLVLLSYAFYYFGYRKYSNIIFVSSLTISYTFCSFTGYMYYNNSDESIRLYGGLNELYILIIILIGLFSIGLLLLLSKIRNDFYAKYSQLFLQLVTVFSMVYILFWIFFTDA